MSERYGFSVFQDGMKVAAGSSPTLKGAMMEMWLYVRSYALDGPVKSTLRHGRKTIGRYTTATSLDGIKAANK